MKIDDEEIALLQQIIMMRDRNQSFQSIAQALRNSCLVIQAFIMQYMSNVNSNLIPTIFIKIS